MGLSAAGIDAGWETGQVLDNCREPVGIYSAEAGRLVERLPLRFVPTLHADNPAVMAPERKRRKPGRDDLGMIDYLYLHRHSWVDRVARRLQEGRLKILCEVPPEFEAHLASNVLRPVSKQHGQDRDREEWVRPDEFRDDWLMALVYAEAAAVLKCRLDLIHAMALAPSASPAPPAVRGEATREGWLDRHRRSGSWWNR